MTFFLQVYKCNPMSARLQNGDLMAICEDLCHFIMKEIIHFNSKYFDLDSKLAQPQYWELVDIARLELNHKDY